MLAEADRGGDPEFEKYTECANNLAVKKMPSLPFK
ncbi:MAG: hypothetical protein ACI9LO_000858 [Planctomycetota bacterium]